MGFDPPRLNNVKKTALFLHDGSPYDDDHIEHVYRDTDNHDPHRPQRVHIGKNISVSFQSLGGGINPAGQNERSVDDFLSLWTCSE